MYSPNFANLYLELISLLTFHHRRTCGIGSSALCMHCFLGTNHVGHDVIPIMNTWLGSFCDCGDTECWKKPLGCKYHLPNGSHTHQTGSSQCGYTIVVGEAY